MDYYIYGHENDIDRWQHIVPVALSLSVHGSDKERHAGTDSARAFSL